MLTIHPLRWLRYRKARERRRERLTAAAKAKARELIRQMDEQYINARSHREARRMLEQIWMAELEMSRRGW